LRGDDDERVISEEISFICVSAPGNCEEYTVMDKNRVTGSAKEAKGAIKEAIGKATGDTMLQADGKAEKAEGKVQNAIGGLKDNMRDAMKT
jgi:uncharacterized protein YjbJ (UPF0337 family)